MTAYRLRKLTPPRAPRVPPASGFELWTWAASQARRGRTGRIVCQCGKGYGSELDGLCTSCRGRTAWEARHG